MIPSSAVAQHRKPIRGSLVWWLRFLGILAFVLLLLRLPKSHDMQMVHLDLRWLGVCMLLTLATILFESLIWHTLLAAQKIRYPYPKTVLAYLASEYLGMVTPGHVGEYLAAGYISMDTGITFGYALSSVVMKKILHWVIVVSFGIWGIQLVSQIPLIQRVRWAVLVSVAVLVILAGGIGLWVVSVRRLARKWEKLSPWQIDMTEFWSGMKHLFSPQLILPLAIGAGGFVVLVFQLDAVLHALGISLPITAVAQIMAFSRIVARIVPLSVVGFGSKDAAIIGMLSRQGIDPSTGLTATLLLLVCSYVVTLLLSALSWWVKPLVVRRAQTASLSGIA